jgi:hypothetical protein
VAPKVATAAIRNVELDILFQWKSEVAIHCSVTKLQIKLTLVGRVYGEAEYMPKTIH